MADLNEVYEIVKDTQQKVNALLEWKAGHQEQHKLIDRDVGEVREVLFENPGIRAQVQSLLNCKKRIGGWQRFWIWILQSLVVAGVIGFVTWLLFVYRTVK